ncbi:hypothetical protein CR513_54181, partial [Mucuna pruriens]
MPWKYDAEVKKESSSVTNIVENRGITRSEKIYAPESLRRKYPVETSTNFGNKESAKGEEHETGKVPNEESTKFLKFISQSEYELIDQLKQTPANISLLTLLMNFESHRKLLMKVLNEVHVDKNISLDKFGAIVNNIMVNNYLAFSDEEIPIKGKGHNRALNISVKCLGHLLTRVLIDNGSSLNVMPKATLENFPYDRTKVKSNAIIVRAFGESKREVMGELEIPVQIGPFKFQISFQIMDIKPVYSFLLGRPWIHASSPIPSSLHQKLKRLIVSYPQSTKHVETVEEALETTFQSLEIANTTLAKDEPRKGKVLRPMMAAARMMIKKGFRVGQGLGKNLHGISKPIELRVNLGRKGLGYWPETPRMKPYRQYHQVEEAVVEEKSPESLVRSCSLQEETNNWTVQEVPMTYVLNLVNQSNGEGTSQEPPIKEVKVGRAMSLDDRNELVQLLTKYVDIFAWSYKDMPGLDNEIVEHRIPMEPNCPPVKQKLRRMNPKTSLKIKEEMKKQLEAEFLTIAKYPQWVANIVPVPKKDRKVKMFVGYRDLNKASPKDKFALPHIDVLVDNKAKHGCFSFMDGFSRYNQIRMALEDMEKITYITQWGTFCYKVMLFRLKNVGATYQRAMVALFHDMMHKEVEVYVDDMITKSKMDREHIRDLRKLFERLRKYRLHLNPIKYTFGVKSGKLLGFIVSKKGIEVDPDKVKAIQEMLPPQTKKEIRGFLGSKIHIPTNNHLQSYFQTLIENQKTEWNEHCQKAFEDIKQYLKEPHVLVLPIFGRSLIMYLTVLEESMGCVLGQHDESGKKE